MVKNFPSAFEALEGQVPPGQDKVSEETEASVGKRWERAAASNRQGELGALGTWWACNARGVLKVHTGHRIGDPWRQRGPLGC